MPHFTSSLNGCGLKHGFFLWEFLSYAMPFRLCRGFLKTFLIAASLITIVHLDVLQATTTDMTALTTMASSVPDTEFDFLKNVSIVRQENFNYENKNFLILTSMHPEKRLEKNKHTFSNKFSPAKGLASYKKQDESEHNRDIISLALAITTTPFYFNSRNSHIRTNNGDQDVSAHVPNSNKTISRSNSIPVHSIKSK